MINEKQIRSQFPIYKKNPSLLYFDTAASSLKLKSMIKELTRYYTENGTNVHRGVYNLSHQATEDYEDARSKIAGFLNAKSDEIVFTKGTTQSLNLLARSIGSTLHEGDEIITSFLEHHSSFLPWQAIAEEKKLILKFIPLTKEGRITHENFISVLSPRTKVIALTHISNVLGYITPIEKIAKEARKRGIITILDCAQSAGILKLDVQKLHVDALAFSFHKIYGPNGLGVLYAKEDLLNRIPPFEYGGEMVDKITNTQITYKDAPYKFEAGTPPIAQAIASREVIKFISKVKQKNIYSHEIALKDYTMDKLSIINGITIYNKDTDGPIISFNIDNVHPHDVVSFLDQSNICIRAGHHCNQLMMSFLNVNATLRISFGVYNTLSECDTLVEEIVKVKNFFHETLMED